MNVIFGEKMTLREIFPEWWCKITFSVPETCPGNYNWLDLSIYEFIFSVVVALAIKWIISCFLFILGLIMPDKSLDATIISPKLLEDDFEIPNHEIEDIKGRDLELDEDVFNLDVESRKMGKKEEHFAKKIEKEIETSIANITRKGADK